MQGTKKVKKFTTRRSLKVKFKFKKNFRLMIKRQVNIQLPVLHVSMCQPSTSHFM